MWGIRTKIIFFICAFIFWPSERNLYILTERNLNQSTGQGVPLCGRSSLPTIDWTSSQSLAQQVDGGTPLILHPLSLAFLERREGGCSFWKKIIHHRLYPFPKSSRKEPQEYIQNMEQFGLLIRIEDVVLVAHWLYPSLCWNGQHKKPMIYTKIIWIND